MVMACALICYASPSTGINAEAMTASEYEIKAAFLYNFAKFVQWPASAFQHENDPMVVGLIGKNPFDDTIGEMLDGLTVQKHPFVLKRIKNLKTENYQVLFISDSEKENLKHVLAAVEGKPVLTVSDISNFVQHGGMIGFEMNDGKIGFNINKKAADDADLQFSSQILKLARVVEGK
jgi:hypothetical protein